nr:hypothetical protein [Tanacetum cinerariifolium]
SDNDEPAKPVFLSLVSDICRDASIIWDDQDQWEIRSWRFYALPAIHVLETEAGDIIYMFVDKKYPILPATIQRMLNHGLKIDRDPSDLLKVCKALTMSARVFNCPAFQLEEIVMAMMTCLKSSGVHYQCFTFFIAAISTSLLLLARIIAVKQFVIVKVHLAPKPSIQVNKISSSCDICGGPYDTQYCMENPEQTFVDYASSCIDEAVVLEVLAHAPIYDALLDKYLKSLELGKNGHAFIQCEMPKKIKDHGLFILPCRLRDFKPFDTLADLGLCVNLTPLYLFKELKIRLLEETENVLRLADGTKSYPVDVSLCVGTFMPPKHDLVFHDAPTVYETVPTAFNVEPSTTKHTQDFPQSNRPSAPINEDWVSDSDDESAVLTRSGLVPLPAARPVNTVVPHTKVHHQRPTNHGVNKAYSPIRRPINFRPSPQTSNFHPTVTTTKAPHVNAIKSVKGNLDENSLILKTFIAGIENQLSLKVKIIRSDNGTEFKNKDLNQFCRMKGIKMEFSVAITPQQNGIPESKNKTLIEAARTMLADSLLPISFWAETVNTACYVQNRVLVTKPHNKTPYELLLGRTPSIGFMRPFGYHVTILNTLDPLENQPNVAKSGPTWLFDIDTLTKSMNYQPVLAGNQPNSSAGIQEHANADKAGDQNVQQYVLFPLWSSGSKDPQNTDDVTTFEVKEPESAVHVLPSSSAKSKKHDDKTKREAKGKSHVELSIGFRNLSEEFEDFSDNSINEVNAAITPIPIVGQISTNNTNTFSAAGPFNIVVSLTLGKSLYVDPSQYPDDLNMPSLVDITYSDDEEDVGAKADFSNLKTNIIEEGIDYEEVFAPVARIVAIRLFLAYALFIGFMVYQMDGKSASLYGTIKEEVYVCQLLGFEDSDYPNKVYKVVKALYGLHQAHRAWKLMKDKFQMSLMGELTFFGSTNGKSASTPIDTEKPLLKDPDGEDMDVHTYRSMIGSLMYLTSSRLDIMFAIFVCDRFHVTPKALHLHAVKRIFSDYAGVSLDRKSTTGGCQFLGCRLISWQRKKQTVVATSSTKAEYVAAASCCTQVLWIQNQLLDYRRKLIITEDTVHQALHLDDAESIDCLPNEEIFAELARMRYEKPSTKLIFYKAFFSAQWKFLIHTILQCMSAKRTAWNEFRSSMALAVICLTTGRKFKFLKYIFDSLVRNVDSSFKFYMYLRFLQLMISAQVGDLSSHATKYTSPALTQKVFANMRRVGKGFSGVDTPLFEGMLVPQQGADDVANVAVDDVADDVDDVIIEDVAEPTLPLPTPTITPPPPQELPSTSQVTPTPPPSQIAQPSSLPPQQQPSQPSQTTDISMDLLNTLLETYTSLTRKVKALEQDKIAQSLEIIKLNQRVRKLGKKRKLKVFGLKRLRKIGTTQKVESSADIVMDDQEDASKEGG